jgi:hypothetical protein
MDDSTRRAEAYESARIEADAAEEAVGDAEDVLAAAEGRRESGSPDAGGAAEQRVSEAEISWLDRVADADAAARRQRRARDDLDA